MWASQVVKNPPANVGDMGSIPGWGRSPGGSNDNALQYSCLENSMDRGAWWAIVHGVTRVGHFIYQLRSSMNPVEGREKCFKIQVFKMI